MIIVLYSWYSYRIHSAIHCGCRTLPARIVYKGMLLLWILTLQCIDIERPVSLRYILCSRRFKWTSFFSVKKNYTSLRIAFNCTYPWSNFYTDSSIIIRICRYTGAEWLTHSPATLKVTVHTWNNMKWINIFLIHPQFPISCSL